MLKTINARLSSFVTVTLLRMLGATSHEIETIQARKQLLKAKK